MTNNVEVWFGDIEFGDFVKDAATSCKVAIVHRIVEARMYPPERAEALAEQAIAAASPLDACDYLIPSQFDGEILYTNPCTQAKFVLSNLPYNWREN